MRTAFRLVATLLSLAVIVQVGLAGYGAFNAIDKADDAGSITKKSIENGFDPHGVVGLVILILAVALVLVSLLGGRIKARTVTILVVAIIVQMLLAAGASAAAWVGFFHGINALLIAGIAGSLAGAEWREARVASAA